MTSEVDVAETGRTGARFGAPARRGGTTGETPAVGSGDVPAPVAESTPAPTGARFGRTSRRERKRAAAEAARTPEPAAGSRPGPPTEPSPEPPSGTGLPWETVPMPRFVDEPAAATPAVRPVRPYVVTGGRTRARMELRIETLVTALGAPGGTDVGERRSVLELCSRPRSVSEVAALVDVPLGVARVLIGDLAVEGRVQVHVGVDAATGPDLALLDRVLAGLRNL